MNANGETFGATGFAADSFYVTGGTLRHDAPCYVERKADSDLLEGLLKGEFCYVLTSRQMGKSSLMVRAATRLREEGIAVAVLDLTAIGQNLTPEQWYDGVITRVGAELGLENELEEFCQQAHRLSPVQRTFAALREVVLRKRTTPVVIFVDEIDTVRSLRFSTDEFFAAVRECYNRRAEDSELRRLTFCLLGVGTPTDLIRDVRLTPFNIGRRIELNDFSGEEACPLAAGLEPLDSARVEGSNRDDHASRLLERVLYWTHGHPYLTQRLCQAVTQSPPPHKRATVDRCCAELFFTARARERDDNLLFVRERLLRSEADRANLLHFYEQVLRGTPTFLSAGAPDDETNPLVGVLRLAGIARREGSRLHVRNRIYARVFDERWIAANMPDAELRRQREAYRRGVARAASVAAVVVLAMTALVALALRSRTQAKNATWAALRDQARLSRASGLPGQRFGALESIRGAIKIKPSPELRDEAIACLALPDLRRQKPGLSLPSEAATGLVFSDDLRLYAFGTAAGEIVVRTVTNAAEAGSELSKWQTASRPPVRIWFAADNRYLAIAHTNDAEVLSIWRRQGSGAERLFGVTNGIRLEAVAFSPNSERIAVGSEDGGVRIFNLSDGQLRAEFEIGGGSSALAFDPTGRSIAVASSDSLKIGLYEAPSGKLIKTFHSASPPKYLAWHPHGELLAGVGEDHRIRLWEIDGDEFPQQELPQELSEVTALAFSHAGALLASASADQTLRLWEPGSGRLLLTLSGSGRVPELKFSADDQQLGFGFSGREMWVWEVASGRECRTLFDFEAEELSAIDVHPNGRLLASAHLNGVTFWDLTDLRMVGHMPVGKTAGARFDPISGDLVSAEFRGTYRFSVQGAEDKILGSERVAAKAGTTNEAVVTLRLEPKDDFYLGPGAVALDLAREADVLAVAYDDRVRLARDTNSAYAVLGEFIGKPGFKSVAISPDGRQVAAGNWKGGEVWIWDGRSSGGVDRLRPGLQGKPRRLGVGGRADVRFSPDGRWLATGTERAVSLWDTMSWQPTIRIDRPGGAAHPAPIVFASNSLVWAVAWTDTRVRLLEMSGKAIADFESPQKSLIVSLAFTPDGSRLLCSTSAKSILAWDLAAISQALAEMRLDADFKTCGRGGTGCAPAMSAFWPISLEIGRLDRLRFSDAKHPLSLRRQVGDLTDLIRRDPGAWHLHRYRAEKLRQLGEMDKAIEDYEQWIAIDRATAKAGKASAWPLRDLAQIYLALADRNARGARMEHYQKALALTQEALQLDPENPDNHFRHGMACYRLERYQEAEEHLQTAHRLRESAGKDLTMLLFYEAMCQAHRDRSLAAQSLERAREAYAQTDLEWRETHGEELSDLIWEAQRVVAGEAGGG